MTTNIQPSQNQDWGFWGTMRERAAEAWPLAFAAIHDAADGAHEEAVRAFLDSRHGRHFADQVSNEMHHGAKLETAIKRATITWMGWKINQRISRETGIPAGLPYLTGHVINEGIYAEAD
jgi:hypothetical protein